MKIISLPSVLGLISAGTIAMKPAELKQLSPDD
jgi:hypothetical protein